MLMKQIGMYLPFPDDRYLLGDSICPCISSSTVGTLMSKSADDICYDSYDLNHKTTIITLFLRDSVWLSPTVWWNNSRTSRTISFKLSVISKKNYWFLASNVNISLPFHTFTFQQWYTCFIFTVTIFNVWTPQTIYLAALPRCTFCISSECGSQFILYPQHHRRSNCWNAYIKKCWWHMIWRLWS
jgi:hypothetical protein